MRAVIRRILYSYIAFIILFVVAAGLMLWMFSLKQLNTKIEEQIRTLRQHEQRLQYEDVTARMQQLEEGARLRNIPVVSREEGQLRMIAMAEGLRLRYSAVMISPVTDTSTAWHATMRIQQTVPDEKSFYAMLEKLTGGASPVADVERLMIHAGESGFVTDMQIHLLQPYFRSEDNETASH